MILKRFLNKRNLYILLTLLWVVVIFTFSLQPADASNQISSGLVRKIVELFIPNISEKGWEILHFLIRKAGHFTEFFVLGIFSMLTIFQTKTCFKKTLGLSFCAMIATMDETIQLFVDGRSGQISDVVLDSVGALVGIAVIVIIKVLCDNKNKYIDF